MTDFFSLRQAKGSSNTKTVIYSNLPNIILPDKIHLTQSGRSAKLPLVPMTGPKAIPVFPKLDNEALIAVIKSNPIKDNNKTDVKNDNKKITIKTNTPDEISSVSGFPLYFAMNMPWGNILRRKYCMDDRYIILKRNILIPPDVDPLHAPIGNKNVKNITAKFPQDSISLFKNPDEVTTEIKLKAAYRMLSNNGISCFIIR